MSISNESPDFTESRIDVLPLLLVVTLQYCSGPGVKQGCGWDNETCTEAASGGHLAVLQWARHEGCDWNSDTCLAPPMVVTWKSCSGPEARAVIGTVMLALVLLQVVTWEYCSGRGAKAAIGPLCSIAVGPDSGLSLREQHTYALALLTTVIWRSCNGLGVKAALGTVKHALAQLLVVIWKS